VETDSPATPDHQDHHLYHARQSPTPARSAQPVHPETPEDRDQQVHPADRDNQDHQDKDPAKDHQAHPDQRDHLEARDNQAAQDNPADQDNQAPGAPAHQARRDRPATQEHQETPVDPAVQDSPAARDLQAQPELPANQASPEDQDNLEHPAALASPVTTLPTVLARPELALSLVEALSPAEAQRRRSTRRLALALSLPRRPKSEPLFDGYGTTFSLISEAFGDTITRLIKAPQLSSAWSSSKPTTTKKTALHLSVVFLCHFFLIAFLESTQIYKWKI